MDYLEVILKNIKKNKIDEMVYKYIPFKVNDIISSHFFDKEKNKDVTYQDINSLKEYFCFPGTCNLYLKKATFGTELKDVFLLIACDKEYGDITINFEEKQFEKCSREEIKRKVKNVISLLINIYKSGEVEKIVLGYEPADDTDMKILEINQDYTEIFNKHIFKSLFTREVYSIVKNACI